MLSPPSPNAFAIRLPSIVLISKLLFFVKLIGKQKNKCVNADLPNYDIFIQPLKLPNLRDVMMAK